MLPKWHVLGGFILALLLIWALKISWVAGAIVFLSSILVDIDHYIIYIWKERKIHPLEFWNWSSKRIKKWRTFSKKEKELHKRPQFLLHGMEALVLIFALSFLWQVFFWIYLGFGLHICMDLIDKIYYSAHPSTKISQIWLWHRNKKKKKVL